MADPLTIRYTPGQNYDCVMCAKGCQAVWQVPVDEAARAGLKDSPLELRVIQSRGPAYDESGPTVLVGRTATGQCVFLDEDKLCSVHREMGFGKKPLACQSFPYMVIETPDGYVAGLSFYCTSAQQNSGRPLGEHQEAIADLIRKGQVTKVADRPVIHAEHDVDWATYRALEDWLLEHFPVHGCEITLGRALWALCSEMCKGPAQSWTPEGLKQVLEQTTPGMLEQDGMISAQMEFFTYSLMAFMEANGVEELRELQAGFLQEEEMYLRRFNFRGTISTIDRCRLQKVAGKFEQDILRYLSALVHRKFLLMKRPVLDNLALMYLLPRLLREYTAISALGREADPAIEDFYKALDVCELDIATHTRGTERLFSALAESVYNQVAALLHP